MKRQHIIAVFTAFFLIICNITASADPILNISPDNIGHPTWTKPGVRLDSVVRLENIGDAELNISEISVIELNGQPGWLNVNNFGQINISENPPNHFDLTVYINEGGIIAAGPTAVDGFVDFESNSMSGNVDSLSVHLIIADTVQLPEYAGIRTENVRINFNNYGNIGNGGNAPDGGWNMNFFDDCDTTNNTAGADDNISVYLREASPFICYIDGIDTILYYSMYNADWTSNNGFLPLESPSVDSISFPDYQYGYSGEFLTHDSNIAMTVEYYAPKSPDSGNFIVTRYKIYNNSYFDISNVFFGEFIDWDIPSDSSVENFSDFDATRKLMYCIGAEYGPDSTENNDCVMADYRLGGLAYYGGYKMPNYDSTTDFFHTHRVMWTAMNADWVEPTGGFVPGDIYDRAVRLSGYYPWESTNPIMPDSQYQDLHMVSVYVQRDLLVDDTLYFVKILATENTDGIDGLSETIDKAHAWIDARPEIYHLPEIGETGRCCYIEDNSVLCENTFYYDCYLLGGQYDAWKRCETDPCPCCLIAGDCNLDGSVNILDVTHMINILYIYPGSEPGCWDSCDANGNNTTNILDIVYIIDYLYKNGPPPVCGTTIID